MIGHGYREATPTRECPYCGHHCSADFVDIGVGMQQCGPYHCGCGASEIGAFDAPRDLSDREKATGWYAPGEPPSDKANVIDGHVVSSEVMRAAYRAEFVGNPKYHDPGAVDAWREDMRKPRGS